jgi:clan AA aspartic protease
VGFVIVKARIGRSAERAQEVEFLVDTGAFHTVLPPELMRELGLEAPISSWATVADNRRVEIRIGAAYLALEGREGGISVAEMPVPMPLLGVSALEALGFKVDPVGRRLEPTRPFGPAVL